MSEADHAFKDEAVELYQRLFLDNPNPVLACYPDGRIDLELVNPAALELLQSAPGHGLLPLPLEHVETVAMCWETENPQSVFHAHREGLSRLQYVCAKSIGRVWVYTIAIEVTQETYFKSIRDQLHQARRENTLAEVVGDLGIINRRHLMRVLADARHGIELGLARVMGLMFVDVNRFKEINDTYGHEVGDKVLYHVARCAKKALLRPDDILARMGGDEFVILIPNVRSGAAYDVLDEIAIRFREELAHPFPVPDGHLNLTVSIGAALYHGGPETIGDILHQADRAMYYSKREGNYLTITLAEEVPDGFQIKRRAG